MKGFRQKRSGNGMFFSIRDSSICQASKEPREGYERVEKTREGKTYVSYLKRYDSLFGHIVKIEFRDTKDQHPKRFRSWRIHLVDEEGSKGVLELDLRSNAASRFTKLAENINYAQPVEFRAWKDQKEDKTAFFVGQGDDGNGKSVSVRQKYTKDNPGECPEPKTRMGGSEWDFGEQEDWLFNRMMNVVIPRVEAVNATREANNGHGHDEDADDGSPYNEPADDALEGDTIADDDIPF